MAYTINLTDGSIFATVADGTINTTSSMILVGKNYAGYGEFLDENFIHLLENGANSVPPGAPLTGQLWWDKTTNTMKVYNGTTFKVISAATASGSAPTSNVTGDLWFDTVNQQLKVWNGSAWILVGPSGTPGQGGVVVTSVSDGVNPHVIIQFFVETTLVAVMSKDAAFTPSPAIAGFSSIGPGLTLSSTLANALFRGTATDSNALGGNLATAFMRSNTNTSTTGTLSVANNNGLTVGLNQDFVVAVSGTDVALQNQTSNGDILFSVNIAGTPTVAMTIDGASGLVTSNTGINANYADVAERFAADDVYLPGTVVELGGSQEITQANQELSDSVFGVISTRAAYLMNSFAGTDATHPPVAMTGRVPVRVTGAVRKGDRLVAAGEGLARAAQAGEATPFNVIGRALVHKSSDDVGTVEAIVTIR